MRYLVYTDGAGSLAFNTIGCSYLILTDSTYISSESVQLGGLDNPTYAETISVGLASAYFIDNIKLEPTDVIEFNIDCASTISFYNRYIDNSKEVSSKIQSIQGSVTIVRQLSSMCRVRFQKVKGHKNVINPNTYVDRLAKLAIRR